MIGLFTPIESEKEFGLESKMEIKFDMRSFISMITKDIRILAKKKEGLLFVTLPH